MITKCGLDCKECYAYEKECTGCEAVCGQPFWTEHVEGGQCPLFKCCMEKEHASCGACGELPCNKWYDLKDPSMTDDEHQNSINKRVKILKGDDSSL
jgi:hypothetical protein